MKPQQGHRTVTRSWIRKRDVTAQGRAHAQGRLSTLHLCPSYNCTSAAGPNTKWSLLVCTNPTAWRGAWHFGAQVAAALCFSAGAVRPSLPSIGTRALGPPAPRLPCPAQPWPSSHPFLLLFANAPAFGYAYKRCIKPKNNLSEYTRRSGTDAQRLRRRTTLHPEPPEGACRQVTLPTAHPDKSSGCHAAYCKNTPSSCCPRAVHQHSPHVRTAVPRYACCWPLVEQLPAATSTCPCVIVATKRDGAAQARVCYHAQLHNTPTAFRSTRSTSQQQLSHASHHTPTTQTVTR